MEKILIIMGSSRSNGDTFEMVKTVAGENIGKNAELIDLLQENVSIYDYEHGNSGDGFIGIAEKMVAADVIIFATPVYWYTMSAPLKTFIDRFSDLITIRKDLGRALKGRKCYVVSCGSDVEIPPGFENPFSATCDYMDMDYKGCFYQYTGRDEKIAAESLIKTKAFGRKIFEGK